MFKRSYYKYFLSLFLLILIVSHNNFSAGEENFAISDKFKPYRLLVFPLQAGNDIIAQKLTKSLIYPLRADLFAIKDISIITCSEKSFLKAIITNDKDIINYAEEMGANYALYGYISLKDITLDFDVNLYDVFKKQKIKAIKKSGSRDFIERIIDDIVFEIVEGISLQITNKEKALILQSFTNYEALLKLGEVVYYFDLYEMSSIEKDSKYEYDKAVIHTGLLLDKFRSDPYIYHYLAYSPLVDNVHEKIMYLNKAITSRKFYPEVYYRLNLEYLKLEGAPSINAMKSARKAVKQSPNYGAALVSLCSRYYDVGDYKRAYIYGLEAVKAEPRFEYAWTNLILSALKLQKIEKAKQIALQGIEYIPDSSQRYENYGYVLEKTGDIEKAFENYKKSINLAVKYNCLYEKENASALFSIADYFSDKGDYYKAIDFYRKALKADPDYVSTHHNIGWCYLQMDIFDQAQKEIEKEIELHGYSENKLVNLSNAYKGARRYKDAARAYEILTQINPARGVYYNNAAWFELLSDFDLRKACEFSEKAIALEPENGCYLATYAWILLFKGNLSEVNRYVEMVIEHDNVDEGYAIKTILFFKNGQKKEAKRLYKIFRFRESLDDEIKYLYNKAMKYVGTRRKAK